MTSSLVGSEMCIRDRLGAIFRTAAWRAYDVHPRHVMVISSVGEIRFHMAVSYTHLTLPTICSV
eukprot:3818626-Prorocentrum_lima.AAC.1